MFATLLGGLPSPAPSPALDPALDPALAAALAPRGHPRLDTPDTPDTMDDQVEAAIRAQEEAGLEPVTDGRLRDPGFEGVAAVLGSGRGEEPVTARAWRFAASLTGRAVKQALPGPYSLGRRHAIGERQLGGARRASEPAQRLVGSAKRDLRERERRTLGYADALRREIEELAIAGCPLIEIEETEAHHIGKDDGERRLFREAHQRLVEGVTGTHLSLSIVGGSAAGAGIETILAAPYASLAVDLVAGPDNWNLVVRLPGDRGVVAGAMTVDEATDQPRELLLWAAHYAASTGGRGIARVGLGSAGSFANLTWASAIRKMQRLGEAARLASMPPSDELMRSLPPAAISARRAALGHDAPPRPRRR
ncbi:MAG TPA: hypothetical protein VMQ65_11560 [Candidatus Limnocylindria bacterium]|nr:hypothetical protein [Candidatus Limnocylindria bacterium]